MDNYPLYARIIYQITCLLALAIMSTMIVHGLVFSIYAVGFVFVLSTNLLLTGWPLKREKLCRTGIYLCLAFYIATKTLIYLYLLYTVHTSREDDRERVIPYTKDYISLAGFTVVMISVITVTILAFLHPIDSVSHNGNCTIGLPPSITITLLVLDVHINIILTVLFMYLSSKVLKRGYGLTFRLTLHALPFRNPSPLVESLIGLPPALFMTATKEGGKRLRMAKALWGTVGLIIPTTANLAVLLWLKGHEQAWLLLWSIVVVHWLTNGTGTDRLQEHLELSS
ncbi:MAG: hypothetical protein Q9225_001145 [Loekoesia sp. 1 TL-2023]